MSVLESLSPCDPFRRSWRRYCRDSRLPQAWALPRAYDVWQNAANLVLTGVASVTSYSGVPGTDFQVGPRVAIDRISVDRIR
jgi:hypothetical protein